MCLTMCKRHWRHCIVKCGGNILRKNMDLQDTYKICSNLFFFRVKDINISDIFYKIQNFLRPLWPSLILTKDLVLLTIWVETFNFEHPGVTNINIHIFVYHNPPNIRISREVEWCPVWKNCLLSLLLKLIFNHQKCLNPLKALPKS